MRELYQELRRRLEEGKGVVLAGKMGSPEGPVTALDRRIEDLHKVSGEAVWEGDILAEPILPADRLIIFGGGHVGKALSDFAGQCGFRVTVADDRPEFAMPERFPGARVLCADFPKAVKELCLTSNDYLVIVTRGHAHDADTLRAVLNEGESVYLGMIGSRKRVAAMLEMLAGEGYDRDRLGRIHTPVGLPIGAVTPQEIAVSILAELISCKRLPEKAGSRMPRSTDLDPAVITALAGAEGPHAIATVLRTRGHSPRGAGAKMLIWPDGTIVGTVGGGLGEALAIAAGRELAGTGRYRLLHLELNADVAAREGMACGGEMEVLVEDDPEG